jgi:hypothetical protein
MSEESLKKTGRGYERNLDVGQFQPIIHRLEPPSPGREEIGQDQPDLPRGGALLRRRVPDPGRGQVLISDQPAAQLDACKGGGLQNHRDYAIISMFKDTTMTPARGSPGWAV